MSSSDFIIIQKYGGATLSDPEKIRQVAKRLSELAKEGKKLVVVVSAMGKTTNQLIELAQQVSQNPKGRELDMLLSTGERVSMALLSLALNDLGTPAISFTGSQAGILTDDSHVSASIIDINAPRVKEALANNKIVVLAGFQGVSPKTKEITTLGRGGSDITAIAMAAYLKAYRCEILKDVDSVFTADPKIVKNAKPIHQLTYQQLLEMTFWGAKFLNYRSVEHAAKHQVPIYIGPAANKEAKGTTIDLDTEIKDKKTNEILAINSHETVLKLILKQKNQKDFMLDLESDLLKKDLPLPQLLLFNQIEKETSAYLTAPAEQIKSMEIFFQSQNKFQQTEQKLSSVTTTCVEKTSVELIKKMTALLSKNKITIEHTDSNNMSISFFVPQEQRTQTIELLHSLI